MSALLHDQRRNCRPARADPAFNSPTYVYVVSGGARSTRLTTLFCREAHCGSGWGCPGPVTAAAESWCADRCPQRCRVLACQHLAGLEPAMSVRTSNWSDRAMTLRLLPLLLVGPLLVSAGRSGPPLQTSATSVTYDAKAGPGKGKHVVFLTGRRRVPRRRRPADAGQDPQPASRLQIHRSLLS